MKPAVAVSAIVITRNEEDRIEACLAQAAQVAAEIVVVDAHSTDRTVDIARRFTSKIFVREWAGYGPQKQFAIAQCSHEWILWIDADERVPPELAREICELDFSLAGYDVPRKVFYLGRWIRHCGWYPGYVLRLFDRRHASLNNALVHESVTVNGRRGKLHAALHHYPYRSIGHHLAKMNDFTDLAARQMHAEGRRASPAGAAARGLAKFLAMYVQKRGFLDGAPGFIASVLGGCYVFLKYAKLYELQKK